MYAVPCADDFEEALQPIAIPWTKAAQGAEEYAKQRGEHIRVQEAAARLRQEKRLLKETEKRTKQQGKGADGGQQLQTGPSSDPHTFLEFDDEELRRGSDDKEQLIVQRGDLGIYTVTLSTSFTDRGTRMKRSKAKKKK